MDKLDKAIADVACILDNLILLRQIQQTGDCNRCKNKDCGYIPKAGQMVRYNCPFYKADVENTKATFENFKSYAKEEFDKDITIKPNYIEPDSFKSLFGFSLSEMRDLTPEEREASNKALRDMSYKTGVTIEGLQNHETYISISEIDELKTEILARIWKCSGKGDNAIYRVTAEKIVTDVVEKYKNKKKDK